MSTTLDFNSVGNEPKPSIAIIGTEGSGKTVLTVALAKRLSTIDSRGAFLDPKGGKTLKYVEKVWQTLQGGEWPPSTPPGMLFQLEWNLKINGEMESEVRLADAAGQDLRLLFGEDQIANVNSLPDHLQKLADYCQSADIVLFLINLKDFTGQGDPKQRVENEAAIKGAMDYLSGGGRNRRFCLLFTQADLYGNFATSCGGWPQVAKEVIPYIHSSYISSNQAPVFPVSAVNKTRVTVDDSGIPRRVPEPGFGSTGFDEVIDWMVKEVRAVQKTHKEKAEEARRQAAFKEWKERNIRLIKAIGSIIFVVCLADWGIPKVSQLIQEWKEKNRIDRENRAQKERESKPSPILIYESSEDNPGFFDDGVIARGRLKNDGAAGTVGVFVQVFENGKEVESGIKEFYLKPMEVKDYYLELNKIDSVRNPHEVKTRAYVPK